jgi:hypothetical protein
LLPAIQTDPYTVSFLNNGLQGTDSVAPNTVFDFPTTGVSTFTVTGIDPADNLDPANATAFDTGLTFVADGNFNGTQTPIVSQTLCFCAGTRIATPSGEVPVERLTVGGNVLTLRGQPRPITWIGIGQVLATRGRRTAATPVIIRKGALADNVPHQDLRVTKGHALYLEDTLIPVEFLVNHRSILWDDSAQSVTLYHIELDRHDVLLANGAPAESYRDDGNRWLFQNASSAWNLPPLEPCAPLLTGGTVVDAVWRRLLERSGPRPGAALTDDPDLHLTVDGERVSARLRHETSHIFHLKRRPKTVRIASRAAIPQELGVARDPRPLGTALQQIALRQGTRFRVMKAADTNLTKGFHPFEPDGGLRWTDGDAVLPTTLFQGLGGPMELVLQLACTTQYPLFDDAPRSHAA